MKNKFLTLVFCLWASVAQAILTPPVPFTGGVDHTNIDTEIADFRAKDCQNVIGSNQGSISIIDGTERFINQAVSTNPINSLYWYSVDRGTYIKEALLMTTWDRIYVSTSPSSNPVWKLLKKGLSTHNQTFSFGVHKDNIVFTGDALTDPPFKYDVIKDSFSELMETVDTSSDTLKFRAKYVTARDGHVIFANIMDTKDLPGSTTYYGDRVLYSLKNNISSFTAARFIDINPADGESITGVTDKGGTDGSSILFYKPNSASNVTYSVLNLTGQGGDINVDTVADGFGSISPRATVNTGDYDLVPTEYGLIFYDGGLKNRLSLIEENRPISQLIQADYERTIKNNTYQKSVAVYYPKEQWLLWSFQDPFKEPQNYTNSVFVYDIQTGEWWPLKGIHANSFTLNPADGTLLYGDSHDGYVYRMVLESRSNFARKEFPIDGMDFKGIWISSVSVDSTIVAEGSASFRITSNSGNNFQSSMTKITLLNLAEWPDKSLVDNDGQLSFKLRTNAIANMTSLRIDFQYDTTETSFTVYASSLTITSTTLFTSGLRNNVFTEIKVDLSSWVIPSEWSDPTTQTVPFSNSFTRYGIRFVANSVSEVTFWIDDVRVVQKTEDPVEWFYQSKKFDGTSVQEKEWRQVILLTNKPPTSEIKIDVFTNSGIFSNTKVISRSIDKEILVMGYQGNSGIFKLNSLDFTQISATIAANSNDLDYMNGIMNEDYILAFDKVRNSLYVLDRTTPSVVISTYGSLGNGTSNFNTVNQMCMVENPQSGDDIFLVDNFNDRVVQLLLKEEQIFYVGVYGELGTGATNFFSPSGITADKTHVWVFDDGNGRIKKFTRQWDFVTQISIDANTIPTGSLQNDGDFLYSAYNRIANQPFFQDVVLERRNKGDMSIIQRKIIRPENVIENSTYTLSGDFALLGKFLFIGFTKDLSTTGTYYVQKLLKIGFDLIDEISTPNTQFSVVGDARPYIPSIQSRKINLEASNSTYIQLRYYGKELDSDIEIFNYSFSVEPKPYEETNK